MSSSSLWVMDKDFNGEEAKEFPNSWLVTPVAWDILLNKYLPTENKRHYISATMFDDSIFKNLNKKINNSEIQEDRVLWEMGNQQVFFAKDKDFIADCVNRFLTTNSEFASELGNHIHDRFAEVASEIRGIDEEKHPYFIFKNTSCDDGVEYWFQKYNDEDEEYEPSSLKEITKLVTEFVVIESNKIVKFVGNIDYFAGEANL